MSLHNIIFDKTENKNVDNDKKLSNFDDNKETTSDL